MRPAQFEPKIAVVLLLAAIKPPLSPRPLSVSFMSFAQVFSPAQKKWARHRSRLRRRALCDTG